MNLEDAIICKSRFTQNKLHSIIPCLWYPGMGKNYLTQLLEQPLVGIRAEIYWEKGNFLEVMLVLCIFKFLLGIYTQAFYSIFILYQKIWTNIDLFNDTMLKCLGKIFLFLFN